jgi:hypothetical protein
MAHSEVRAYGYSFPPRISALVDGMRASMITCSLSYTANLRKANA